jgi:hypothetical protein
MARNAKWVSIDMDDIYYPAIDYHRDAKPSYFPLRNIIYMYIWGVFHVHHLLEGMRKESELCHDETQIS